MPTWSTDTVAPAERESYWVEAVNAAFLRMHTRARNREYFHGSLSRQMHGPLALVEVYSVAQDVHRLEAHLRRNEAAAFYLIQQTEQPWSVAQDGRLIELAPRDLVLVDAARPYHFHCPEGVHNLSLELPRAWLDLWLDAPPTGQCIDGQRGLGLALSGLLQALRVAPSLPTAPLLEALGATLQLLGAQSAPTLTEHDRRWLRALDALQARLGEPGLQASDIARDAGCSSATLHRLFGAQGRRFADTLRELRLQRAAQMLRAPALARLSVAEIGHRCGFSDPSHFSRVFLAHQGCSPGRWRGSEAPAPRLPHAKR